MFEVTVTSVPDAEAQMLGQLSQAEVTAVRSKLSLVPTLPPSPAPFCQLAYDEIPMPFLERIFSYASISKSNGPIGFAGTFEPIARPPELVLFPLSGLLGHLKATVPEQLVELYSQGEPDRFISQPDRSYGSAQDFLVAGTLACIQFASRFQCAFVIRW